MSTLKRAQILIDSGEYKQLERIAKAQNASVAELVRRAVRERYLLAAEDRTAAATRIAQLGIPTDDWADIDDEIAAAHQGGARGRSSRVVRGH
jgi:hypothetical protein